MTLEVLIEVFFSILNQGHHYFQRADYLELQFWVKEASYVDYQSGRASKPTTDKMLQENDFQIYLHFNKRIFSSPGN